MIDSKFVIRSNEWDAMSIDGNTRITPPHIRRKSTKRSTTSIFGVGRVGDGKCADVILRKYKTDE
jgi:hypothetical protein